MRKKLLDSIDAGTIAPGDAIGSARELAARFHVSPVTANRVLSDLHSEGKLVRVKGRGSFAADPALPAKPVKRRHFALAFPDMNHGYPAHVHAAFDVFHERAKEVLTADGHTFEMISFAELHDIHFAKGRRINGMLLSAACLDKATTPILTPQKFPMVIVQPCVPMDFPFHQILPDVNSGFFAAAKAFRDRGTSHITALTSEDSTGRERVELFIQAALWAGYKREDISCISKALLPGDLGQLTGYQVGMELLEHFKPGQAYFVPSDFFAFGVLSAFLSKNLKPDEDFQLISFDNLEADLPPPFGEPMLTSVDFPKKAIAEYAVRFLEQEMIKPSPTRQLHWLPVHLVERKTFRIKENK